jgi:hypothetical protein
VIRWEHGMADEVRQTSSWYGESDAIETTGSAPAPSRLNPVRRAALDALERELSEYLKNAPP